jgi:hypothetical protein
LTSLAHRVAFLEGQIEKQIRGVEYHYGVCDPAPHRSPRPMVHIVVDGDNQQQRRDRYPHPVLLEHEAEREKEHPDYEYERSGPVDVFQEQPPQMSPPTLFRSEGRCAQFIYDIGDSHREEGGQCTTPHFFVRDYHNAEKRLQYQENEPDIREEGIVVLVAEVAPDEELDQLHGDERREERALPDRVERVYLVLGEDVVVRHQQQHETAEHEGIQRHLLVPAHSRTI